MSRVKVLRYFAYLTSGQLGLRGCWEWGMIEHSVNTEGGNPGVKRLKGVGQQGEHRLEAVLSK